MNTVETPELLLVIWALLFWLVPILALGWGLVTLHRINVTQKSMQETLAAIERALRERP
jgi:hypothetical protein